MPPNFSNKNYYDDIGCAPDDRTVKFKNPVNYAKMRAREHQKNSRKRKKVTNNATDTKNTVKNTDAAKNTGKTKKVETDKTGNDKTDNTKKITTTTQKSKAL